MQTIFTDLDGTLIHHYTENGKGAEDQAFQETKILPGVAEQFKKWNDSNCRIIITTARTEELRSITEKQLQALGLKYDILLMNLPSPRILINDLKPTSDQPTAIAINLTRNQGFSDMN